MASDATPELCLVYVTAPTFDVAAGLAEAMVESRLAACANILPGMTSIYHWQGKIERASECVLILKTRKSLVPRLTEGLIAAHPYETPCVLAIDVAAGARAYMDWLYSEASA